MVYHRPSSLTTSEADYVERYGSVEEARRHLYNVGAGAWSHPCWSNIDLPAQSEAFANIQAPFIAHDLVSEERLPLEDASVDAFYCSHVIEHLPEAAGQRFLAETRRCLMQSGVLRLTTGPCADLDWQALLRRDESWWYWFQEPSFLDSLDRDLGEMKVEDYWLFSVATPRSVFSETSCDRKYAAPEIAELVKKHCDDPRPLLTAMTEGLTFDKSFAGNHISWWNYEKLEESLRRAGFTTVTRSGYGQSVLPIMRDLAHFDQTYPQITVYVEAW